MRKVGFLVLAGVLLMGAAVKFTADQVNFRYPATGGVVRLLTTRLADTVSVKDFGAAGNGTTDDRAAIQSAIDSLPTNGGEVYFPPGTYNVTAAVATTKNNVRLRGASSSYLNVAASELVTSNPIIILDLGNATTTNHSGTQVENLGFRDNSGTALGAIRVRRMNHVRLKNVSANSFTTGYALRLDGTGDAIVLPMIEGSRFRANLYGIQAAGTVTSTTVVGGYYNCAAVSGAIGIDWNTPTGDTLRVVGAAFEQCVVGVKIQASSSVISSRFEANTLAIQILSGNRNVVTNSTISSGTTGVEMDAANSYAVNNTYSGVPTPVVDNTTTNKRTWMDADISKWEIHDRVTGTLQFILSNERQSTSEAAEYLAKYNAGAVVGTMRAATDADGTNRVYYGSTTSAPVRFMRNNVTITELGTVGVQYTGFTLATLGAPNNGTIAYCSDCTVANPCAGGGTGAVAKRLNGAWVCN